MTVMPTKLKAEVDSVTRIMKSSGQQILHRPEKNPRIRLVTVPTQIQSNCSILDAKCIVLEEGNSAVMNAWIIRYLACNNYF